MMTRYASYPIVDITLYQKETLNRSYEKLMPYDSTTNTWIVSVHFSSNDSVVKKLSRKEDSLILCIG